MAVAGGCDGLLWRRSPVVVVIVGCLWLAAAFPVPNLLVVFPVDFDVNKTSIASMKSFPVGTPCVDDNGVKRAVGESWVHGCDRNYCHGGQIQNYTLMYRCRAIGELENRNKINCREMADLSQPFPYCCPTILCAQRNVSATPSPPTCFDVSPSSACAIWSGELGGCAQTSHLYNITSIYCRLSCGFCQV